MSPNRKPVHVEVISDRTGITAERVITRALVQFSREFRPVLHRHHGLGSVEEMERILDSAEERGSLVVYTLARSDLALAMAKAKKQRQVEIIDIFGPVVNRLTGLLQAQPQPVVVDAPPPECTSLELADTLDFTLLHDDGQNVSTVGQADVIILGVSRTSKTPTSIFLALNYGLKVANVPLMMGIEPPKKLFNLKRPKLVGLFIAPDKLLNIRRARFKGRVVEGYNDMPHILAELRFAQEIFDRLPRLHAIDVTDMSIEDTARLIA